MTDRNKGGDFNEYVLESLRNDDQAVFLHIKEALENPNIGENDYLYLLKAIKDVATARGKGGLAESAGLSRQGLHKILNGGSVPSLQNVMAILGAIGLRFSVEQIQTVVSENRPASVLDVAAYAANLIVQTSTYMKLQKIVYYAQVESLVHYSRPLFSEKILAWRGGPVVRELFNKHRGLKFLGQVALGDSARLSIEQKACVSWAVEKYARLDGDTLSHLTHIEAPWKNARKGLSPEDSSDAEITPQAIKRYYSGLPKYRDLDEEDEKEG